MSLADRVLTAAKALLMAVGVYAVRRRHLRFGVDYLLDVAALARLWNQPVRVVFDVGANLGQTSERFLTTFPAARVVAFEPHGATYLRLTERFAGIARFEAVNLALSDTTGATDFFEYEASALNSLTPLSPAAVHSGERPRTTRVECTTMDGFCASHAIEQIDLLKIDTEGQDLTILKGAKGLLAKRRIRFVYVEFNDINANPNACGGSLADMDAWLSRFGFKFIASYTDFVIPDRRVFVCANALFALQEALPKDASARALWSPCAVR